MGTTRPKGAALRFWLAMWLGALIFPAPAYSADPLTMFLIGFARNLITSAIEANRTQSPPQRAMVVPTIPMKAPGSYTDSDLRLLVNESFAHLTHAQREELLASLEKTLADPANATQRDVILSQFVNVARQVQFTHMQLNRLSSDEKRLLADRFASNFRSLTPDQQQALQEQLTARALPLPSDLNDMMLAALPSR